MKVILPPHLWKHLITSPKKILLDIARADSIESALFLNYKKDIHFHQGILVENSSKMLLVKPMHSKDMRQTKTGNKYKESRYPMAIKRL